MPELNLKTGTVGKLIKEMERKIFPNYEEEKDFMDQWLKDEDIRRRIYQGSASFDGNQAEKILLRGDTSMNNAFKKKGDEDIFLKAEPFLNTVEILRCCEVLFWTETNC